MFDRRFFLSFGAFILINIFLYVFIFIFHASVLFNSLNYITNADHYTVDPRIIHGQFNLLQALGQFDSQWYLKIADSGYASQGQLSYAYNPKMYGRETYAFFPFYPMVLSCFNFFLHNPLIAGFILANLLLIANFTSLYYVIGKLDNKALAIKSIFLLFLFPFSIFYRSYFSEGIFLLLLIWFSYFLIKKNWLFASTFLSFIYITRPNGPFLSIVFIIFLIDAFRKKKISLKLIFASLLLSILPFSFWMLFCYLQTGDLLFWYHVQSVWSIAKIPILYNVREILAFGSLPFHSFHASRIDVASILLVVIILFWSRKWLKPQLWLISCILWIVPLLVKDTMSYTRYQMISFPLFMYLAHKTNRIEFIILSLLFAIGLGIVSIYFVNWYWIG